MRYLLRLFALSVFALASASAQDQIKAEPTDLTIKSFTKLVQVPVIVRDKAGRAVKGLTKDDFVLYEDGKPVKISSFQASVSAAEQAQAAGVEKRLPPGEYTNVAPQSGKPVERPVVILMIDTTNIQFLDQAQARAKMIKFLGEKIEAGTLLTLMVNTRLGPRVIHDYTTDPKVLIAALQHVRYTTNTTNTTDSADRALAEQALNVDNETAREAKALADFVSGGGEFSGIVRAAYTSMSLAALNSIASRFANVPGRKSLLWVASNFPYFGDDWTAISSTDPRGRFVQTLERLNDANIALYPIDAGGLLGYNGFAPGFQSSAIARNPAGVGPMGGTGVLAGTGDTSLGNISASRPVDNMKVVAELTGGIPFYGTNDLAGAMKKAADDAQDYYMLGYYLTGGESDKTEHHKLKVSVNRKDVTVRSRSKLVWMPAASTPKNEIWTALQTPLEYTAIPLKVKFDRSKAEGPEVPFEIQVSPDMLEFAQPGNAISLNVVVEARNASGTVVDRIDQTLNGKITRPEEFRSKPLLYANKLMRLENAATVKFLVRDNNSGRIGSVIVETR
jgi:VWFA-related protein